MPNRKDFGTYTVPYTVLAILIPMHYCSYLPLCLLYLIPYSPFSSFLFPPLSLVFLSLHTSWCEGELWNFQCHCCARCLYLWAQSHGPSCQILLHTAISYCYLCPFSCPRLRLRLYKATQKPWIHYIIIVACWTGLVMLKLLNISALVSLNNRWTSSVAHIGRRGIGMEGSRYEGGHTLLYSLAKHYRTFSDILV